MTITHDRGTKQQSRLLFMGLITTATIAAGVLGVHAAQQVKLRNLRDAEVDLQQACNIRLTNESIVTSAAQEAENATRSLKAIPNLPGFDYAKAQNLLTTYAPCTARIQARSLLQQTPKIDQSTILPASDWKTAQSNLSKAVQLLQTVPKDAPLSQQANQELSATRTKLALVNQRLQQEEAANNAIATAESLYQSTEQTSRTTTNLEALSSAQQNYRDAIQTLRSIPKNTTVYDRAQQNLSLYRTKLQNIEIRYAEQLLQPLLKDLRAFSNALSPSMEYAQYAEQFRDLKARFEEATRSEAIKKQPIYAELSNAIEDYNNALNVWSYCNSGKCYNSLSTWRIDFRNNIQWLPGNYSVRGKLLTDQYSEIEVSPNVWGQRYIQLSEALTQIWESGDRHLKAAQQRSS